MKYKIQIISIIIVVLMMPVTVFSINLDDLSTQLKTQIIDENPQIKSNSEKTEIKIESKKEKFTPFGVVKPGGNGIQLYDAPNGVVIGNLYSGKFLDILNRKGEWVKVSSKGISGWAKLSGINMAPEPEKIKVEDKLSISGTVKGTGTLGLNVRDGAWGEKIGHLANGASITITGSIGDWYKIDYNGKTGYVYKSYVKASGKKNSTETISEKKTDPEKEDKKEKKTEDKQTAEKPEKGKKVPIRSQRDPANGKLGNSMCGPTSLGMILDYYGKHPSSLKLAKECGTTLSSGTYAGALAKVGEKYGLSSSIKTGMSVDAMAKIVNSGKPVIAHVNTKGYWGYGHYYVVTGVRNGKVIVNDPWKGAQRTYTIQQFKTQWSSRSNRIIAFN